jgi:hypothetical protein
MLTVLYLEVNIGFSNTVGHARYITGPTTLSLNITVSANAGSSPTTVVNIPSPRTADPDDLVDQEGAAPPIVQSNSEAMQPTEVTSPLSLSLTGGLPIEGSIFVGPATDTRAEMSHTLDIAEEAMDAVKTWRSAVYVIKQVMDHVGPMVTVCLTPLLAYRSLS